MADRGYCFDAMAQWISELHCLKYTDDLIRQQAQVELGPDIRIMFQQAENPTLRPTRLIDFGDKLGYNGAVPSAKYLSFMYKSMHKKIRAHIDQQQQCQVESDMLAIDASFKAMSHLARVDGIPEIIRENSKVLIAFTLELFFSFFPFFFLFPLPSFFSLSPFLFFIARTHKHGDRACEANGSIESIFDWAIGAGLDRRSMI
jgi:hypothetical protein